MTIDNALDPSGTQVRELLDWQWPLLLITLGWVVLGASFFVRHVWLDHENLADLAALGMAVVLTRWPLFPPRLAV